jgi:hypothetical protein
MINLKLSLTIPWWDRFENIYCCAGKTPIKHKFWEVQVLKSDDIATVDLRITTRCDHAGIDLWVGAFGYSVNLTLYDNRHWNHEENRYYVYHEDVGRN